MNRNRYMLVFDFETDGKLPETCNIVQIAAVPVDLRNLTILSDEIFNIDVRPDEMANADYFDNHEDTILWHASIQGCTPQKIMERWGRGFNEKDGWLEFASYIKNYSKGTKFDQQPIPAGQNIRGYDLPICERYIAKYCKLSFAKRDVFDLMDLTRAWFMFSPVRPDGISLDTLRDFFGMPKDNAHDAKQDVIDCAHLITKFLALHERIAPGIKWKKKNEEAAQKV